MLILNMPLSASLQIMGLATIDPRIPKTQTKLYKIPKFASISEIQPFENVKIYKEVYGHLDAAS